MAMTHTENGALTFASSGDPLVDLYFRLVDGVNDSDMRLLLEGAWRSSPLSTLKVLFDLRNCRGGKGRHHLFAQAFAYLLLVKYDEISLENHPLWFCLMAQFGSFKDFFRLADELKKTAQSLELGSNKLNILINELMTVYAEFLVEDVKTHWGMTISEYSTACRNGRPKDVGDVKVVRKTFENLDSGESEKEEESSSSGPRKVLSLAAKYAPKEKGYKYSGYSKLLMNKMGLTLGVNGGKAYRWLCADLRDELNIVEKAMSSREWDSIKYSKVSSLALKRYLKAFRKHDEKGFKAYMESVKKGEAKANVGQLYPHDFVNTIRRSSDKSVIDDTSILFDQFLEKHAGVFPDSLAMVDVSGSMSVQVSGSISAMDVAVALGIVISWNAKGPHAKKFVTFSTESTIEEINGETWSERIGGITNAHWSMSTNIQAAFENILKQGLVVKRLFIISDMQFNEATKSQTNFEVVKAKYAAAGLTLPQVVFWNVSPKCQDVPVRVDESGTILLSGFSTAIVKSIYEDPEATLNMTPRSFLDTVLASAMYENVLYIS